MAAAPPSSRHAALREEEAAAPMPSVVVGNYQILQTLGQGTFGKVKAGIHIPTGERVAIKILEKARIKEVADAQRVAREIRILKRLRHPNIVSLFEVLDTPRQILLVMEYVDGGELFDYIVRHQRLREDVAVRFFHDMVEALGYLHRKEVAHRDLKPENVLLARRPDGYRLKIIDFGLSNMFDGGRLLKTACGSPCYAAPELLTHSPYRGETADIWSLGVCLFAMVCGYLPYEDANTAKLYDKILRADYKPPRWISNAARDLIARIFITDPNKRYSIADIRRHPWYTQVMVPIAPLKATPASAADINPAILAEAERLGIDRATLTDNLLRNAHNNATATYYLIAERMLRRGELTISEPTASKSSASTTASTPATSVASSTATAAAPVPVAAAASAPAGAGTTTLSGTSASKGTDKPASAPSAARPTPAVLPLQERTNKPAVRAQQGDTSAALPASLAAKDDGDTRPAALAPVSKPAGPAAGASVRWTSSHPASVATAPATVPTLSVVPLAGTTIKLASNRAVPPPSQPADKPARPQGSPPPSAHHTTGHPVSGIHGLTGADIGVAVSVIAESASPRTMRLVAQEPTVASPQGGERPAVATPQPSASSPPAAVPMSRNGVAASTAAPAPDANFIVRSIAPGADVTAATRTHNGAAEIRVARTVSDAGDAEPMPSIVPYFGPGVPIPERAAHHRSVSTGRGPSARATASAAPARRPTSLAPAPISEQGRTVPDAEIETGAPKRAAEPRAEPAPSVSVAPMEASDAQRLATLATPTASFRLRKAGAGAHPADAGAAVNAPGNTGHPPLHLVPNRVLPVPPSSSDSEPDDTAVPAATPPRSASRAPQMTPQASPSGFAASRLTTDSPGTASQRFASTFAGEFIAAEAADITLSLSTRTNAPVGIPGDTGLRQTAVSRGEASTELAAANDHSREVVEPICTSSSLVSRDDTHAPPAVDNSVLPEKVTADVYLRYREKLHPDSAAHQEAVAEELPALPQSSGDTPRDADHKVRTAADARTQSRNGAASRVRPSSAARGRGGGEGAGAMPVSPTSSGTRATDLGGRVFSMNSRRIGGASNDDERTLQPPSAYVGNASSHRPASRQAVDDLNSRSSYPPPARSGHGLSPPGAATDFQVRRTSLERSTLEPDTMAQSEAGSGTDGATTARSVSVPAPRKRPSTASPYSQTQRRKSFTRIARPAAEASTARRALTHSNDDPRATIPSYGSNGGLADDNGPGHDAQLLDIVAGNVERAVGQGPRITRPGTSLEPRRPVAPPAMARPSSRGPRPGSGVRRYHAAALVRNYPQPWRDGMRAENQPTRDTPTPTAPVRPSPAHATGAVVGASAPMPVGVGHTAMARQGPGTPRGDAAAALAAAAAAAGQVPTSALISVLQHLALAAEARAALAPATTPSNRRPSPEPSALVAYIPLEPTSESMHVNVKRADTGIMNPTSHQTMASVQPRPPSAARGAHRRPMTAADLRRFTTARTTTASPAIAASVPVSSGDADAAWHAPSIVAEVSNSLVPTSPNSMPLVPRKPSSPPAAAFSDGSGGTGSTADAQSSTLAIHASRLNSNGVLPSASSSGSAHAAAHSSVMA